MYITTIFFILLHIKLSALDILKSRQHLCQK